MNRNMFSCANILRTLAYQRPANFEQMSSLRMFIITLREAS